MPVKNAVIHHIDKKPDGSPAVLHLTDTLLPESQVLENLHIDLCEVFNAKPGKVWGLFHAESGAYPLVGWLNGWLDNSRTFLDFTRDAVEHLCHLLEESALSTGGHVLFAHYQQGMTEYLNIAVLLQADGASMGDSLELRPTRTLDLSQLPMAARINLSEWRNNPNSRQYISMLKGKTGRRTGDLFRDFIGCQEGIDGPGETRTLLKAFSDYIEAEDVGEERAREMTSNLVAHTSDMARLGATVSLADLSELIDEDRPASFADFIKGKDYGLSPEIPADKRVINQFRRFTGRVEGLSISFEAHMLGSKVEYDEQAGTLTIKGVPTQLADQIKRAANDK